jgi:hypothetical protein
MGITRIIRILRPLTEGDIPARPAIAGRRQYNQYNQVRKLHKRESK